MDKPIKLPGQLTITRPTRGGELADAVEICFKDMSSRIEFATAIVDLASFTKALTGLGHQPCEITVHALDLVGMMKETKTEAVFVIDGSWETREERAAAACKEWETNGWIARVSDTQNHYKQLSKEKEGAVYRVCFLRWVPAVKTEQTE